MSEGGEEVDLVADLLTKPFSNRTFPERLDILRRGRPTPKLVNLSQPGKGCVRHFQSSNYKRYSWLTASEKHCKLYCWTCLLFLTERQGVWSRTGFANLSCLTKALARHHSSAGHLQATVLLKTFGEIRVDPQLEARVRRERVVHNEKVKKNREILKKLIDCVMFLGKQGLSLGGHDEKSTTNRGNYLELLALLAENNTDLHFHLSTNTAFNGTPGKIQNDLIDAIAQVTTEEIKSEIRKAPFVAIMGEDTTDESSAAQLALVLRYVTDSGVKERFIRFEDVAMQADDIAALIVHVLEEHACLDKVVSQSYHGTAVMSCGLQGVQVKVKEKAPLALFIHSYAHRLDLVLTQAASKLKECKIFFAHLYGLAAFFSRSLWRTQLLDDICQRHLNQAAPTQWHHATRLVGTVFQKRVALKELFCHMLEHHEEYDDDTIRGADVLNARLDDLDFFFLLHMFKGIFEYADMLFTMLQNKALDVHFCLERVKEFCDTIERERERFDQIYEATERMYGAPSAEEVRTRCQRLHGNILDDILCQVRNRFEDHGKLMFLSLLDPQQFEAYRKKFPLAAFSSLTDSHGALFDLTRLKTELTVMYAMRDFEGKSPADLLEFLLQKNLHKNLEQLYTLTCLALTVPVSRASVEPTVSALKRIQTYAKNTRGRARVSALASMAIERDFLMELKRSDQLYDRVIELFSKKEMRIDFVYK